MDSCKISVRLVPRAKVEQIAGERDGALLVRVTAPPVDGRANAALCRLLAKRLGIGATRVTVLQGASSREKLVGIDGISAEQARIALHLRAR